MDIDDLAPCKLKPQRKDLDELSIESIGEYIQDLKDEVKRAQAAIVSKQAARVGADAFFK